MDVAAESNSRSTGFLSGIYLLGDSAKDAGANTGPGDAPGKASIGYGGRGTEIVTEVNDSTSRTPGSRTVIYYNGHFCDDNLPGGNQWKTANWNNERHQFFTFLTDWKMLDGNTDAPDLNVRRRDQGGRHPCLTGTLDALIPAWKAHNMTYDTSMPAPKNGIFWPVQVDGIWEFYMPQVYSPGFEGMTTAMDYNFWAKFNGAKEEPDTAPELRDIVKGTYEFMWDQAYNGNRAPILIANHFNKWNGDSFNPVAMIHEGEVHATGHLLRDLPGRHRLDGAAGSGGARRAAGPGTGRGHGALTWLLTAKKPPLGERGSFVGPRFPLRPPIRADQVRRRGRSGTECDG